MRSEATKPRMPRNSQSSSSHLSILQHGGLPRLWLPFKGLQETYRFYGLGFSKTMGTFFGVPIIRIEFWGQYWGPPILGYYHTKLQPSKPCKARKVTGSGKFWGPNLLFACSRLEPDTEGPQAPQLLGFGSVVSRV